MKSPHPAVFLAMIVLLVCGCRSDVLPWKEANRIDLTEGSHVTARDMYVVLQNPGPYRVTKFRFELGKWNADHSELRCHAVDVNVDMPPKASVRIRLPLRGDTYRCDRNSSIAPSVSEQVLDLVRDRIHKTQVCASTDDPAWQWSLVRVQGTLE
jgi:hypothetical protein